VRLDPVFAPLRDIPAPDFDNISAARAAMSAMQASLPRRQSSCVVFEDRTIKGIAERITIRTYIPRERRKRGALLYFHGGAFMVGNLDSEHSRCLDYAENAGCVVISVDYRLAPECPFPAAHDDAWCTLLWLVGNADELGVDPSRIAVGGASAGASIAAGLALRARDEGGPSIHFALLVQPALDHLSSMPSARTFVDTPFLTATQIQSVWRIYLGPNPPTGSKLSYAAPFCCKKLTGFPSTCLIVGDVDPLRDEGLAFAMRLIADDTEVELHLLPGAPHGFDLIEDAPVTKRMLDTRVAAMKRALTVKDGGER
jgi:acetyl esterase